MIVAMCTCTGIYLGPLEVSANYARWFVEILNLLGTVPCIVFFTIIFLGKNWQGWFPLDIAKCFIITAFCVNSQATQLINYQNQWVSRDQ